MNIREISSAETLPLRNEVLRPGKPVSECIFEGDDEPDTHHFAAIDNAGHIQGVVSAFRRKNPLITGRYPYQIRAMAVSSRCRGQGLGRILLASAEDYIKSLGSTVVWANARSSAVGFYRRQCYQVVSDEFDLEGVGPHYLVTKSLPADEAHG